MAKTIRLATEADAGQIADIYAHFVVNTPVSFESDPPDADEMLRRIGAILEMHPWLICDFDGAVAGYAYASPHRPRRHYRWSVDMTVYVHEAYRRQRIGRALYTALLGLLPLQNYVSAYAGITLPNAGSVGLHEAMGFSRVGVYNSVGYKLGMWHDVGWWQRELIEPMDDPKDPVPIAAIHGSPEWNECLENGVRVLR